MKTIMGKQYCSSACLLDCWYLNSITFSMENTFLLPPFSIHLPRVHTRNEDKIVTIVFKIQMKACQCNILSIFQRLIWLKPNV